MITHEDKPLEVASRYVYPSLRRRLVGGILREKGLKQTEIASLLHITQSAVSRYLRMNRGGALIDVSSFPDVDSLIKGGTADWILMKGQASTPSRKG